MYKARLGSWGFGKNSTADDFLALAKLLEERKRLGKQSTEFLVHGRKKTIGDLDKHIKSKKMSERDFLAAARDHAIPTHVRAYSPDPGGTRRAHSRPSSHSPSTPSLPDDSKRLQLTPSTSASQSPLEDMMDDNDGGPISGPHVMPPNIGTGGPTQNSIATRSGLTLDEDFIVVPTNPLPPLNPSPPIHCDRFQRIVDAVTSQLVAPVSLRSSYGVEDVESYIWICSPDNTHPDNLCSACHQPRSAHIIEPQGSAASGQSPRNLLNESSEVSLTLPSSTRESDGIWRWVHLCYLACIRQMLFNHESSMEILADAAAEFERILLGRDRLTLTALNLMVAILHMHDQGEIAKSILQSALMVAEQMLEPADPIRITVAWATAASARELRKSAFTSDTMRGVHQKFDAQLGATHPYTLAASYNLAWMLLLEGSYSDDKDASLCLYREAEQRLQSLHNSSVPVLGSRHMQTLMTLTTLSRAQSLQGKYDTAMRTIQKAIKDCEDVLGQSHPFTLEAKRRLALMHGDVGQKDRMETIYWEVLRGRVKMLGPSHSFTKGARTDLEALLKDMGKWDEDGSTQRLIDQIFTLTSPVSPPLEAF
jgi:hypothetical protein